jgi:ketosteroid isomerase-like protein
MSHENIELVGRMFERRNAGDVEGSLACWHTDAE